jgi:autotransporter-associated beta strand protein
VAPALTAFPVSGYGTGTRYLLDAPGTTAPSADVALASLTVDSAAGAVTLDAGTYAFAPSGNTKGVGMLCRGPNDVTLIGTAWRGGMGSFFNFLGEEATLGFDVGALPMYVTWGGTGFTVYGGTGLGGGDFCLCGGVFRLTTAQTLAFSRRLALLGGGVLELGADLNGAAAGDFSLACGLANGTVSLFGDAGFSAAGADRTVNLGGAGAALTWGAGGFLMHPENIDNGYALKLASSRADATLTFINPINLGGGKETVRRVVEVADGAAAVDAALAGAVTGNEDAALVKAGPGTLKVTAAQRYGALRVHGGTLLAADGCFAAGAAVPVLLKAGAALAGVSGGSNAFGTLTLAGDAALDVGDGSASLVFADSSGIDWHGARLTVRGKLQNGKVRFGAGAGGLSAEQLAGIVMEGDAGVRIDADGWLVRVPRGTMLSVR